METFQLVNSLLPILIGLAVLFQRSAIVKGLMARYQEGDPTYPPEAAAKLSQGVLITGVSLVVMGATMFLGFRSSWVLPPTIGLIVWLDLPAPSPQRAEAVRYFFLDLMREAVRLVWRSREKRFEAPDAPDFGLPAFTRPVGGGQSLQLRLFALIVGFGCGGYLLWKSIPHLYH